MATKTTDFLFGCKNLYSLGIHPFDFSKSDSDEYKAIIELGKEIIRDIGLQSFPEFIIEYQYHVGIWSSFITLEFGKLDQNEILQISGTKSKLSACLEKIEQNEINELPSDIVENKNNWITKIKTCYNNGSYK
ncbi:hypothetical protein [Robertkochia solimangrovi]|uniref:hypothetical protein n=1 Tax=Robertkochia solimangrovi TaxID=2213046 RepID=UPI001180302B|nr:hypothetical protein [Robertkochia solimangrovi]TRZ42200.1 hypothetical protein DMZ48_14310 [Robertkochia solimangrovi]